MQFKLMSKHYTQGLKYLKTLSPRSSIIFFSDKSEYFCDGQDRNKEKALPLIAVLYNLQFTVTYNSL